MLMIIYRKRGEISELLNSCIDFEIIHQSSLNTGLKNEWHFQALRIKYYTFISIVTAPTISCFTWLHHFYLPCMPGNFGYLLLNECSLDGVEGPSNAEESIKHTELLLKLSLVSVSTWMILFSCATVFLEYCLFTTIQCYCLLNYLRVLKRKLESCSNKNISTVIKRYQQIQLLISSYNNIHRSILTPIEIGLYEVVFILSLYGVVGLSSVLVLPLLLLFGFLTCECILLTVEAEDAIKGQVYRVSKSIIRKLQSSKLNSNSRRCMHSLPILSIHMGGSGNFYDETTPLVLLNFAVNQTVGLLLME
ncbi:unnamed protein product [Orchesella dallaii]|uniref:Uncharacterized protein n=1 Tax=Orchesella dallaii TaxID=48710 RepID=A0ABP1RI53_9HEXA